MSSPLQPTFTESELRSLKIAVGTALEEVRKEFYTYEGRIQHADDFLSLSLFKECRDRVADQRNLLRSILDKLA